MDGDAGARANQRRRTRKGLLEAAARLSRQGRGPSLDMVTPEPEVLFSGTVGDDPVARLEKVDAALHDVIVANEAAFRVMLAGGLPHRSDTPPRQNRRSPLIAAALAPARKQFKSSSLELLERALAVMIGTEAMVVFKDVLQLDDTEGAQGQALGDPPLVEATRK
jgi:hypothetical protein